MIVATLVPYIPAMTSGTQPWGEVTANSQEYAGFEAWRACGTAGQWWQTGAGVPSWIQYDFGTDKQVKAGTYSIQSSYNSAQFGPVDFKLQGRNVSDGTVWTDLDSRTSQSVTNITYYGAGTTGFYRYYRLYITATVDNTTTIINHLQIYGNAERVSTDPGTANVKSGVTYTINDVAGTGAYSPDFPDTANVRDTDTVNGTTGSLSSSKILKSNTGGSGAGNYNDDNLNDGNVKSGITYGLSGTGSYTAAGVSVDEIFNGTVGDGTLTLAQSMRILLAGMAGKTSGQPGTPAFTSINGTSTVIQATVDTNGNRTAVTVTP